MRIAVFGNEYQQDFLSQIKALLERLAASPDVSLAFERSFGAYLARHFQLPPHATLPALPPSQITLALSFGGDGTVLRTARAAAPAGRHGTAHRPISADFTANLSARDVSTI